MNLYWSNFELTFYHENTARKILIILETYLTNTYLKKFDFSKGWKQCAKKESFFHFILDRYLMKFHPNYLRIEAKYLIAIITRIINYLSRFFLFDNSCQCFYPSQVSNELFLIDNSRQCFYPSKVYKDLMECNLRTWEEKLRWNASYVKALIMYQLSLNKLIDI